MGKTELSIAVASVLFLSLISSCVASTIVPSGTLSKFVSSSSSPKKMRIESITSGSGLDICSVWLESTSAINYARYYYQAGSVVPTPISNPPNSSVYQDIDIIDGTMNCNIVALDSMKYYVSGETPFSADVPNAVAIGVSSQMSGWQAIVRYNTNTIPQFTSYTFTGDVETRRLSDSTVLVAAARLDTMGLLIGTVTTGVGSEIKTFSTASVPRSISIAAYTDGSWVVCALTDQFICVFSNQQTVLQTITTTFTAPTMMAISFVDCNNVAYVLANQSQYVLNLLDTTSYAANGGGYYSAAQTSITAIHMATTQKTTSILLSNSTGVYIDFFSWSFPSACSVGEPVPPVPPTPISTPSSTPQNIPPIGATPSTTPLSTPGTQTTPLSVPTTSTPSGSMPNSPNSPASNGTSNPGTSNPGTPPPSNVAGPIGDGNTPKGVDAVALGVGIAVPVAVLGAGAFLLVFFLRKRNKKRKQEQDKTMANPLKDIDSPPPSTKPTEPGVYQNLPTNNTTNSTTSNTYTSLGNVANDSYATASVAIELPEIDKRLHIPYKSLVFIKEIGAGSYGKVFLGEWRGAKVAIKVNNQITDVDGFLAEAKLTLGIAPHPNLVQTFGVSLDGPNPCIVLEYCGGGSLDLVLYDTNNELETAKQREYAMKIAYGLLHLHNNNIVHRDLAARNILLTNDQQPKISDFGMSRIIQEENSKGHTKTNFGPIRWMAPESLRDRSYSVKSDVWSYGIVVNEILSRQEPHVNEDQLSIAVKIRDQAVTPAIPSDGDPVLVSVIHKCLKADPKDRPTMEELCQFLRAKLD